MEAMLTWMRFEQSKQLDENYIGEKSYSKV